MYDLNATNGLERLEAIACGELDVPPMWILMGIKIDKITKGEVSFVCTPKLEHYNPWGNTHGGFGATLLDTAVGCSIQSMLPPGVSYTTLELKVNYIRPMTTDTGEVRAVGKAIHVGRRSAVARRSSTVWIWNREFLDRHFWKAFRKHLKVTPAAYRRQWQINRN